MIYRLKIPTLSVFDNQIGEVFHYSLYIEAETFPTKTQVLGVLDKLIMQEPHEDWGFCKMVIDSMKDILFDIGVKTNSLSIPYNLGGIHTYYQIESINVQKVIE